MRRGVVPALVAGTLVSGATASAGTCPPGAVDEADGGCVFLLGPSPSLDVRVTDTTVVATMVGKPGNGASTACFGLDVEACGSWGPLWDVFEAPLPDLEGPHEAVLWVRDDLGRVATPLRRLFTVGDGAGGIGGVRATRRPHGVLVEWTPLSTRVASYTVAWADGDETLGCDGPHTRSVGSPPLLLPDVPVRGATRGVVCAVEASGRVARSAVFEIPPRDETPPVVRAVTLDTGGVATADRDIRLALSVDDASRVDLVCIKEKDDRPCGDQEWRSFARDPVWTLLSPQGPVVLHVWVEDEFQNQSARYDARLMLDQAPPKAEGVSPTWSDQGLLVEVGALSDALDPSPGLVVQRVDRPEEGCGQPLVLGRGHRVVRVGPDLLVNARQVVVCAVDAAGNAALLQTLEVPRTPTPAPVAAAPREPPAAPAVSVPAVPVPAAPAPDAGKEAARLALVDDLDAVPTSMVALVVHGGSDGPPDEVCLDNDRVPSCRKGYGWTPYPRTGGLSWDLATRRGRVRVQGYARWGDAIVGPLTAEVTVDDRPPRGGKVWVEKVDGDLLVRWDGFEDDTRIVSYRLVGGQDASVATCRSAPVLYEGLQTSFFVDTEVAPLKQRWAFGVCALDAAGWSTAARRAHVTLRR